MGRVGGHAVGIARREASALLLPELLGGHGLVASVAEATNVCVDVEAALRERGDVVGHGRRLDHAAINAVSADRFGSEAALALLDAGAPT